MNAPLDLYLFHFQAEERQQNLTYFMRADGTREGKCLETKGGFFSQSAICFFKSPYLQKNIPKNYPALEI